MSFVATRELRPYLKMKCQPKYNQVANSILTDSWTGSQQVKRWGKLTELSDLLVYKRDRDIVSSTAVDAFLCAPPHIERKNG